MSQPIMSDDGKCIDRNGEFYKVSSCYRLPFDKSLLLTPFDKIMGDIDELQNKPRRFFDTLLSIMEAKRNADPLKDTSHKEYWDYIIRGCEMWSSAIDNGLYGEVIKLSEPLDKQGKKLKNYYLKEWN